ncbi:MAG: LacI family DNA-binding transcriptional regulator [Rhodothermales bacterium]|nr:LacI family DNA-binding transcriptional regulator [Rhodothermales bacterium]MBO6778472.1 LacI family DNA-binding transcriptional regulator [Rhodothermales bacterium]
MPTIYDIASRAGVSIATVSRVFNGSPRVSDRTKRNVLAVAEDLGYSPHATARSLARRRSSVVAAVIPMLTNYFFVEILRGLQDRMAQSEYDLLVFAARTLDEVDMQMDRALQRGQSAGILVFSSPMPEARVKRLQRSGRSIVLVDCFHADMDAVSINNEHGGRLATEHLITCGCKRVGLIMANPESEPARDRHTGYLHALAEAGIDVDPSLIETSNEPVLHGYSEQSGYQAMRSLLNRPQPPDGVFATSDIQAIGALRALREAGRSVPSDTRLVGFDDILISRHVGLTTVRQPMYEMGVIAAERLIARIENPDQVQAQTVLSPRLVVRQTTEVPA